MKTGSLAGVDFTPGIPRLIATSGTLLLLWSIGEPVGLLVTSSPEVFRARYLIGYVTIIPSTLALMWGGKWLAESDISPEYDSTVAVSVVAGGSGFLVFNVFLMLFFPSESPWIVTNWVRWALSLGMGVGLVIGVLYSRGLAEGITAERHSLQAEHLREQRELIDQMNSILRHEVLNSAQVIMGVSSLLKGSDEKIDPDDERLDRLHRQGEELSDVVREVRALLHVVDESSQFEAIDLSDILRQEVEKIRSDHPDAAIETSIPDEVFVEGDELIARAFGNVFQNAVEHNEPGPVRITVGVETTDGEAIVTIEDDGGGIPNERLDGLFERPERGTHGLGLYIVERLLDNYQGTIELVGTGTEGTTFEITLPLSDRSGS